MKRHQKLVLPLNSLRTYQVHRTGGKALSLGRLSRAGFPVPPGFVVTTHAFLNHVGAIPGWSGQVQCLGRVGLTEVTEAEILSERLSTLIIKQPIAPALIEALEANLGSYPKTPRWSVRSSATCEDLPEASFAGQYDTFLNVTREEIADYLRKCWASLFTPGAILSRVRNRISQDRVAMAAIVQEMVPAEAAGVLFTANPSQNPPHCMVVEAAPGVGDKVVRGMVTPARWVLDRQSFAILEHTPGLGCDRRPCKKFGPNPPFVLELARCGRRAEHVFSQPLDIEWAVSGQSIFLLQARPITTMGSHSIAERQVWTNANAGEALPEVVTPMTLSILWALLQRLVDHLIGSLGIEGRVEQLLGIHFGRPYFNGNMGTALLRIARLSTDQINEIFGGAHQRLTEIQLRSEDLPRVQFRPLRLLHGLPSLLAGVWRFSRIRDPASLVELVGRAPQLKTPSTDCSDHELVATIQRALPGFDVGGPSVLRAMGSGAFLVIVLYRLAKHLFGAEGSEIAGRLLAGLGTLNPAEAARELWALAEFVHNHAELERVVSGHTNFAVLAKQMEGIPDGVEFMGRWRAFLTQYGQHTRGEVELRNPRWAETPDLVLAMLRNYLEAVRQGISGRAVRREELLQQRTALEQAVRARLSNPLSRALFFYVLRRARFGVAIKENVKAELVRAVSILRLTLIQLGERLTRRGVLNEPDDIFFLAMEELSPEFLDGDPARVATTISRRRAEFERNRKLNPPPIILGRGFLKPNMEPPACNDTQQMSGIAASPGLATGRARVIQQPSEEDRVLPGEILIAPYTDPGWSPYFLTAGGIVVDLGGVLSHGSILAREFGIPAVVNVGSATSVIHTGDLVQVNGNAGHVSILERAPS